MSKRLNNTPFRRKVSFLTHSKGLEEGSSDDMPLPQSSLSWLTSTYNKAVSRGLSTCDQAIIFAQSLLASDFSGEMDKWLSGLMEGKATIYDKAMDAVYNATNIGGGYHRLFDGGHSLFGAIKAGHNASVDDSIIQEAAGTVTAILKDLVTPQDLPLFTWENHLGKGDLR